MSTKKKFSELPFFLIFFASYPVLYLLAWNIREVEWQIVIRPLGVSLFLLLFFLVVFQVLIRDWGKSSLLTLIVFLLLFSYGHVLNLYLTFTTIGKPNRILLVGYLVIFLFSFWWFLFKQKDSTKVFPWLNFVSLVLIAVTIFQIVSYQISERETMSSTGILSISDTEQLPDIYYIILDGYNREDLLNEMGYDNSEFIEFLRSRGFYVADCSRSNYRKTMLSVASVLNMDYVYNYLPNDGNEDTDSDLVIKSIRENRVRAELKNIGYTDIAFNMGYKWATWWDADQYLPKYNRYTSYLVDPALNSFEIMFIRTTLLKPLFDKNVFNINTESNLFFEYWGHYERVHYILNKLSELVTEPGPKLVYVHLIVPHSPYIFLPDGSYDPSVIEGSDLDDRKAQTQQGYLNNIAFINNRMEVIIDDILQHSEKPPIILLQADHSLAPDNHPQRFDILNAYYLPGVDEGVLYPTITPVNSFRVVFNQYFGADFLRIEDTSMDTDLGHPFSNKEAGVTLCP